MSRLSGKRAIVTGAASGIGRASARIFAREGAAVVAVDRAEEGLAETVTMIEAAGGRAMAVSADVGDEDAVSGFIKTCVESYGGLTPMPGSRAAGCRWPSRRWSIGRISCGST